jgi:hypothetical protein
MHSHRNTQHNAFRLAIGAAIALIISACSNQGAAVPEQAATPTTGSSDAPAAQSASGSSISNDLIINFPSPVLASPLASPVARDLPAALPIPSGGNATITGVLVDARTGTPMANTTVRFAVTRQETFVVDTTNSPSTVSDGLGRFVLPNLKADTYIMVIGDPYSEYTFAPDLEKPTAIRIFDFKADKINNVDVLIVNYDAIKPQQ